MPTIWMTALGEKQEDTNKKGESGEKIKKKKVLNKIKTSERVCLEYCNNTAVGDN